MLPACFFSVFVNSEQRRCSPVTPWWRMLSASMCMMQLSVHIWHILWPRFITLLPAPWLLSCAKTVGGSVPCSRGLLVAAVEEMEILYAVIFHHMWGCPHVSLMFTSPFHLQRSNISETTRIYEAYTCSFHSCAFAPKEMHYLDITSQNCCNRTPLTAEIYRDKCEVSSEPAHIHIKCCVHMRNTFTLHWLSRQMCLRSQLLNSTFGALTVVVRGCVRASSLCADLCDGWLYVCVCVCVQLLHPLISTVSCLLVSPLFQQGIKLV